jgi:hypothetical protein
MVVNNREVPDLNMTSVGKCCLKIHWENMDFRFFQILGYWIQGLTLYLSMRHVSTPKMNNTAVVFTNMSHFVDSITTFLPCIKKHVGVS